MKLFLKNIFLFTFCASLIVSCKTEKKEQQQEQKPVQISAEGVEAVNPFLVSDHNGNAVLSWVEGEKENTVLCFAVSENGGESFGEKVVIAPSKGLTPHQESMPKVAFKKDGTIVAVFGNRRRVNRPDAMFEGEIYFSQSFDKGKTWSEPKFLHSDTASGYSRSFFDIATLPDGEIGAIWIDGRNKLETGSSIYFAKTNGKNGFGKDKLIAKGTCECCRTEILADEKGNIHVAFRHIFGGVIRDMAYMKSANGGETFTEPERISADNWFLDGCPHTGPSLAVTDAGLRAAWFTNGNGQGVFTSIKSRSENDFSERSLISEKARHPQLAAANKIVAITYDEAVPQDSVTNFRIAAQLSEPGTEPKIISVSENSRHASHPVILTLAGTFVIAWVQESEKSDKKAVFFRKI